MEHIETNANIEMVHNVPGVTSIENISEYDVHGHGVFTPQDVLNIFNVNFMDYDFARLWVLKRLHPNGANCPACSEPIPENKLYRFWSNQRISCRICGKYFTALTGTFIAGCQMDFRGIILLSFLLSLGIHDQVIAKTIDISKENVRLWRLRFKAISMGGEYESI
jgi:transposase-like protein